VDYINALTALAEAETHHPDVHLTSYRNVRVVLSTHAVGGLTMPDFILAAKLDALPWADFSPKWLREQAAAAAQDAL
jgi:4a-hydroxytetrahydrobiopterin dehydratase